MCDGILRNSKFSIESEMLTSFCGLSIRMCFSKSSVALRRKALRDMTQKPNQTEMRKHRNKFVDAEKKQTKKYIENVSNLLYVVVVVVYR